jgi:hypothetical protein
MISDEIKEKIAELYKMVKSENLSFSFMVADQEQVHRCSGGRMEVIMSQNTYLNYLLCKEYDAQVMENG